MARGRQDAQRRPKGRYYLISEQWRRELQEHLDDAQRGAHARLAREIGCSAAAITGVLKPSTKGSRLVEPISRALGMALPTVDVRGDLDVRWMDAGRALDDEDFLRMVELAEKLAKSKSC